MKKALNIEIGARVREARERLHMSRDALSELLNISTLFLSYIECGQKGMSTETLIRICKTLNVSADYLLLGKAPSELNRGEAEALLYDIPDEYYPLAEDSLRLLFKTIATVQAGGTTTAAPQPEKRVRIAARNGDHAEISLDSQKGAALDSALEKLKRQPESFFD